MGTYLILFINLLSATSANNCFTQSTVSIFNKKRLFTTRALSSKQLAFVSGQLKLINDWLSTRGTTLGSNRQQFFTGETDLNGCHRDLVVS